MANFTSGEWKVTEPEVEPQRFIIDCELPDEGEKRFHRSICRMFGYCDTKEEELANARLISQAPKMYEAIRSMLNIFDRDLPESSIGRRVCDDATKVLAEIDKEG